MDPTTLVTNVMTVLIPYVTKGAEEFARLLGEATYNKAKNLFDILRTHLSGDKEASYSFDCFQEKPKRYQPVVEDILKEKLAQDHAFAADLEDILKEMGPELSIVQRMQVGEKITGLEADEMAGGTATITQEIDQATDVVGARIKRIEG